MALVDFTSFGTFFFMYFPFLAPAGSSNFLLGLISNIVGHSLTLKISMKAHMIICKTKRYVKSTLLVTVYQFTILVKHTIYQHCCAKNIWSGFLVTLGLYLYIKVEKLKYKGSLTLVSSHGYHIPCCYSTIYTLNRLLLLCYIVVLLTLENCSINSILSCHAVLSDEISYKWHFAQKFIYRRIIIFMQITIYFFMQDIFIMQCSLGINYTGN